MECTPDGDFAGMEERWEPEGVQGVHEFIKFAVQIDNGGGAVAGGMQRDFARFVDDDGVGTEQQKVRTRFDGEEPRSGDVDGACPREAFDAGSHGYFELEDFGGGGVAGIDRFAVADHGQGQDAAVGVEDILERVQADPQSIGVEVAVAVDVLEGGNVFVRALGDFTEDEPVVRLADGQVAALLVCFRAAGDFHDEGGPGS